MGNTDKSRGIIAWFVYNPVAANILMLLITISGLVAALTMRREAFPVSPPSQITVSVDFPSGSPQRSEEGVVLKIENAIRGIAGIKTVTSVAGSEQSSVTIEKEASKDIDELLAEVKNGIDAIPDFPRRAERPVVSKTSEDVDHVIWVQLFGDAERRTLEDMAGDFERDLYNLPGVSRVDLVGHREPEIHIEIDEAALQKYGLSLSEVSALIQSDAVSEIAGLLRSDAGDIALKADRQGYWVEDFASIPIVTSADGVAVRLGDISKLVERYSDLSHTWCRFQGQNSIGFQIYKGRASARG